MSFKIGSSMTLINQSGGCTWPQVLLGVGVRFRDTSLWMGTACSGQSWTCRKKQRHKCRHVFLYLIPIPTPQGKSTFYEWRLTPHSWPYNRPLDVSRVTRKWPVQHQQDGESRDSTNGEGNYGRYEQADYCDSVLVSWLTLCSVWRNGDLSAETRYWEEED